MARARHVIQIGDARMARTRHIGACVLGLVAGVLMMAALSGLAFTLWRL